MQVGVAKYLATLRGQNRKNPLTGQLSSGLCVVKASHLPYVLSASADDLLQEWLQRLGHLNSNSIMKLNRAGRLDGSLDQVPASDVHDFQCKACILGKGKQLPSPDASLDTQAVSPLELVHIDLWGPASTPSMGGCKYFLTCYDDYTCKIHLTFLKRKCDAFSAAQQYIAKVERQLETKVKSIRSDNGGKFISQDWKNWMQAQGIQHVYTPPDAHAQNGRVERVHLTILNGVRTVFAELGLGSSFWAEAANYCAYMRNRTPCG